MVGVDAVDPEIDHAPEVVGLVDGPRDDGEIAGSRVFDKARRDDEEVARVLGDLERFVAGSDEALEADPVQEIGCRR